MGLAIAAWSSFAVCSLPVMSAKAQQRVLCEASIGVSAAAGRGGGIGIGLVLPPENAMPHRLAPFWRQCYTGRSD